MAEISALPHLFRTYHRTGADRTGNRTAAPTLWGCGGAVRKMKLRQSKYSAPHLSAPVRLK